MKKDRLTVREKFENQLNLLSKFPFLSLLLIGIGAITIRLVFFQDELIFKSDNLHYFKYAVDLSITGESPIILKNDGWSQFLSIFFKFLNSENFLDYMNLQSYISIVFSTSTIIPLYFLAKRFTNSLIALISTILFVFDPRIIANSLIGVTDPLFILLVVTSLALIVQKNKFVIYGSCITIVLASIVRAEGLFLIPALCTMFLIKNGITKKNIIQCIIFIIIIYLIMLPFSMQRNEITGGNDNLTGRIFQEAQTLTGNNSNTLESKITGSISLFVQFFVKLMIPYLWIFVPVGVILFLKEKNIKKSLLIIPGFFLILPSLYAYTVPALDSRYLFPILPILCIIGTFSFVKYFQKTDHKKIVVALLILIILSSSISFLVYKNFDMQDQQEFLELANIVNKNTNNILYIQTNSIIPYLDSAKLSELKEFPVLSSNYSMNSNVKVVQYTNIENFFSNIEKNDITHIVIDREMDNPVIIKEIFDNYEKYDNLKKIFDSQENGFNYKIEIFEIKY